MPLPILYSFRRCPYAMRARLALLASGRAVELREVALRAKPQAMLAASPKGTVPVLVLPDGSVIDESLDIMRWVVAPNGPGDWPAGDAAALIAANDGPFKHHLDRYKYPDRHGGDPVAHRDAGLAILAELERRLMSEAFLGGASMGFVDMAIFPFARQFAAVDPDWFAALPLPCLQRWLAAHAESALFARVMLRVPPWREGEPGVLFAP